MELTGKYIASQVFTIIMYIFLALSYLIKDRKKVLWCNYAVIVANALEYLFLDAYAGLNICIIAHIRSIYFLVEEKKRKGSIEVTKKDIIFTLFTFVAVILATIITYNGFLSLFPAIGTIIYGISICQKNRLVYRLCGIPIEISWLIYNIYVQSLFGIILEVVVLFFAIVGSVAEIKRTKRKGFNGRKKKIK